MSRRPYAPTARSRPVYHNVRGAPRRIGQSVIVQRVADETADHSCLGKHGTVEYFEYSCGCGQTYPHDPMIGVRFADHSLREFWPEELKGRK